ncbi:hypothetical protein HDV05_002126, partial [Chytridiales sp. JEL 0842]
MVAGGIPKDQLLLLSDKMADIVVATPGRLLEILEDPAIKLKFRHLKVVVLDEAHQLLDMGFSADLERIQSALPAKHQTFLISPTLSKDIKSLASDILEPGYKYINDVPNSEIPTQLKVKQSYVIAPYSLHLITLLKAIEEHEAKVPNSKIIVFFNAAKLVSHVADIFNQLDDMFVMEIQSSLFHSERVKITRRFRQAQQAILFSSDLLARKEDYPEATLVIQFGVPAAPSHYIHRLGRLSGTKDSEGLLIMPPYEKHYIHVLRSIVPLERSLTINPKIYARDHQTLSKLKNAVSNTDPSRAYDIYLAYMGFYKQLVKPLQITKDDAVRGGAEFSAAVLGFEKPPKIPVELAKSLRLDKVVGLRMRLEEPKRPRSWKNYVPGDAA